MVCCLGLWLVVVVAQLGFVVFLGGFGWVLYVCVCGLLHLRLVLG